MSAKKELFDQSRFVELGDEDLKEALGFLWDRVKRLKEAEQADPEIVRLKAELKSYINDNFDTERKAVERDLKAARYVAQLRGIKWKAPK